MILTHCAAPLLEARALCFKRQDEPVFAPLSFRLDSGDMILLEGANGSGKTTLMRLLTGLLQASSGEVLWRGRPLHRDRSPGDMLFIGHHLGLKARLTPRENLRTSVDLYGAARTNIDAALGYLGLDAVSDEPVYRLSAGQKKRSALARLLLIPATLWLLDEPFVHLDGSGVELMNHLLARHTARHGAVLLSSHDQRVFHTAGIKRMRMDI